MPSAHQVRRAKSKRSWLSCHPHLSAHALC